MAITSVTPVSTSVINHGDTFEFTVDDTYTSMVIQAQSATSLESVYNSATTGAQAGYTVVLVDNGDGTHTFTVGRDAGWDITPQLIYVTEDETGSSAQTSITYTLSAIASFPQGQLPYSDQGGERVTSVHGRTGAVLAVAGDYSASEVTNDSGVTGTNVDDALDTLETAIEADSVSLTMTEGAAASTPDAGTAVLYTKTDGKPYWKDDAGTEWSLSSTAGTFIISDGSDVDDTGRSTGDLLEFNGSNWVDVTPIDVTSVLCLSPWLTQADSTPSTLSSCYVDNLTGASTTYIRIYDQCYANSKVGDLPIMYDVSPFLLSLKSGDTMSSFVYLGILREYTISSVSHTAGYTQVNFSSSVGSSDWTDTLAQWLTFTSKFRALAP